MASISSVAASSPAASIDIWAATASCSAAEVPRLAILTAVKIRGIMPAPTRQAGHPRHRGHDARGGGLRCGLRAPTAWVDPGRLRASESVVHAFKPLAYVAESRTVLRSRRHTVPHVAVC